jgi:hypothetical protein
MSKLPIPALKDVTLVSSLNSVCARVLLGNEVVADLVLLELAKGISFAKCTSRGLTQSFFIEPAVPGLAGDSALPPSPSRDSGTGGPIGPDMFGRPPFKFGFEEI